MLYTYTHVLSAAKHVSNYWNKERRLNVQTECWNNRILNMCDSGFRIDAETQFRLGTYRDLSRRNEKRGQFIFTIMN